MDCLQGVSAQNLHHLVLRPGEIGSSSTPLLHLMSKCRKKVHVIGPISEEYSDKSRLLLRYLDKSNFR